MTFEKRIPNLTPFTDASMGMIGPKDRPYSGSLNPIWCERECAIEQDLKAGEYVTNHIRNWNFNSNFDHLFDNRFQHEFCHILLGLAFLKMGRNPTDFDFGYDGNNQAEAFVIAMELPFDNMLDDLMDGGRFSHGGFAGFSEDDYVSRVKALYLRVFGDTNAHQVAALLDAETSQKLHGLSSVFEARRRLSFDDDKTASEEMSLYCMQNDIYKNGRANTNGETLKPALPMSDDDVREIYRAVAPVIRAVVRAFEQDNAIRSLDFFFKANEIMNALKTIYVSDLWHVMQNPETEIELRLPERNPYLLGIQEYLDNIQIVEQTYPQS